MKRRNVGVKETEAVTGTLTEYVGFVDSNGDKNRIVRIEANKYAPVCKGVSEFWGCACDSVKEVLDYLRANELIDTIFCFDSAKELLKWMAE